MSSLRKRNSTKVATDKPKPKAKKDEEVRSPLQKNSEYVQQFQHFVPLPLLVTIMICSGFLWVMCFRDVFATGRPIFGEIDVLFQEYIKSGQFFEILSSSDDESGVYLKSYAGGLSAIKSVTTDANNMGGLFVRKICGAAGLTVHSQKLISVLFQSNDAHWHMGHFNPMLILASLSNMAIVLFLLINMEDLQANGLLIGATICCLILIIEASVMLIYFTPTKSLPTKPRSGNSKHEKTPNSVVSRILTRTITIVSGLMLLICGRDLLFPGIVLDIIPYDDIYLEWTGSFIHSPPLGSEESISHSIESSFYLGDKFISQLGALYLVIGCIYKFVTAYYIRMGKDMTGEMKCKIIWRVQTLGDALLLLLIRLFASAALTASFDLRWHLMCVAYEMFIMGK